MARPRNKIMMIWCWVSLILLFSSSSVSASSAWAPPEYTEVINHTSEAEFLSAEYQIDSVVDTITFRGATCSAEDTFGATYATGSKKISIGYSLPDPHYSVLIQANLWFIDADPAHTHTLTVEMDSSTILSLVSSDPSMSPSEDLCGDSAALEMFYSWDSQPRSHNQSTISLQISVDLEDNEESFGISNITLYSAFCHFACLSGCNGSGNTACSGGCSEGYEVQSGVGGSTCVPTGFDIVATYATAESFLQTETWYTDSGPVAEFIGATCNGAAVLGAGEIIEKGDSVWAEVPTSTSHDFCAVQVDIWAIDAFDGENGDKVSILIDNFTTAVSNSIEYTQNVTDFCVNSAGDKKVTLLTPIFSHTSSVLYLDFALDVDLDSGGEVSETSEEVGDSTPEEEVGEESPPGDHSLGISNVVVYCGSCFENCQECVGVGENDCESCTLDFQYLHLADPSDGVGSCFGENGSNKCQNGYYEFSSDVCHPCGANCLTCSTSGDQKCTDCDEGYMLHFVPESTTLGACLSGPPCQDGFFEQPEGQCTPCDGICKTCENETTCTQCNSGDLLHKLEADATSGDCIEEGGDNNGCQHGFFLTNGECHGCSENCQTCEGYNAEDCLSCGDLLLHLLNSSATTGECHESLSGNGGCQMGYFFDSGSGNCHGCSSGCGFCSSASPQDCESCISNYYYHLDNSDDTKGSCFSEASENNGCQSNYYFSPTSEDPLCYLCSNGCTSCEGANSDLCLTCDSGYHLHLESPETTTGQCFTDSSSNNGCQDYYYETSDGICLLCDSTCIYCASSSFTDCYACSPSHQALHFNSTDDSVGQCLIPVSGSSNICQPEFYESTTNVCQRCHSDCETCGSGSAGDCTSCSTKVKTVWHIANENATAGECYEAGETNQGCQLNYFKLSNGVCQLCDSTCETCTSAAQDTCLTCQTKSVDTLYWYPEKNSDPSQGECKLEAGQGQECNAGFYLSTPTTCLECSTNCKTCNDKSSHNCLSCKDGTPFHHKSHSSVGEGACFAQDSTDGDCQIGYYLADKDTSTCLVCHDSCQECIGQGESECSTCKDSFPYLHLRSENVMFGWCLEKYTDAQNCKSNYFLVNPEEKTCQECDTTCDTCINKTDQDCSSCPSSLPYLHILDTNSSTGFCSEPEDATGNCQEGYFLATDNQCQSCHNTCKHCSSSLVEYCTACISNEYLLHKESTDSTTGSCLKSEECLLDYYRKDETCLQCHSECKTCSGPSESDCLSCEAGEVLLKETSGEFQANSCLPQCPTTHYEQDSQCYLCDPTCTTCGGPSREECASCAETTHILIVQDQESKLGNCTIVEPDKCQADRYYPVSESGDECVKCDHYFNANLKACIPCEINVQFSFDTQGILDQTIVNLENPGEVTFYAKSTTQIRVSSCHTLTADVQVQKLGMSDEDETPVISHSATRLLADDSDLDQSDLTLLVEIPPDTFEPDAEYEMQVVIIPEGFADWKIESPLIKLLPRSGFPPKIDQITSEHPFLNPTGLNELEIQMVFYDPDFLFVWSFEPADLQLVSTNRGPIVSFQGRSDGTPLDPGTVYTFTVTIANKYQSEFATLVMTVNSAPQGGDFVFFPTEGIELQTAISHFFDGWTDEHLPLRYEMYSILPDGSEEILSTISGESLEYSKGQQEDNYELQLVLYVYDAYDAFTRTVRRIRILPQETEEKLLVVVEDKTTELLKQVSSGDKDDQDRDDKIADLQSILSEVYMLNKATFNSNAVTDSADSQKQVLKDDFIEIVTSTVEAGLGMLDTQGLALSVLDELTKDTNYLDTSRVDKVLDVMDKTLDSGDNVTSGQASSVISGLNNVVQVIQTDGEETEHKSYDKVDKLLSKVSEEFIKTGTDFEKTGSNLSVRFQKIRGFQLRDFRMKTSDIEGESSSLTFPESMDKVVESLGQQIGIKYVTRSYNQHPATIPDHFDLEFDAIGVKTVEVTLIDVATGKEINVEKLDGEIKIEMPANVLISSDVDGSGSPSTTDSFQQLQVCTYWDAQLEIWLTDGCDQRRDYNSRFFCFCTHLTEFSVIEFKDTASNSNVTKIDEIHRLQNLTVENAVGVYVAVILFVMFILSLGYALTKDRESELLLKNLTMKFKIAGEDIPENEQDSLLNRLAILETQGTLLPEKRESNSPATSNESDHENERTQVKSDDHHTQKDVQHFQSYVCEPEHEVGHEESDDLGDVHHNYDPGQENRQSNHDLEVGSPLFQSLNSNPLSRDHSSRLSKFDEFDHVPSGRMSRVRLPALDRPLPLLNQNKETDANTEDNHANAELNQKKEEIEEKDDSQEEDSKILIEDKRSRKRRSSLRKSTIQLAKDIEIFLKDKFLEEKRVADTQAAVEVDTPVVKPAKVAARNGWKQLVVKKHPVLSIICVHSLTYSRASRVIVLYAILLGQLTVIGTFYQATSNDADTHEEETRTFWEMVLDIQMVDVYVAIISSLILSPVGFVLALLHTRKEIPLEKSLREQLKIVQRNHLKLKIAIVIAVIWSLFCVYAVAIYSSTFQNDDAYRWVITWVVSIFYSMTINFGLKLLCLWTLQRTNFTGLKQKFMNWRGKQKLTAE